MTTQTPFAANADAELLARAEARVRRKAGFLIHLTVYACVNLGLYLLHGMSGSSHGLGLPVYGWGLGLAIHGIVTLVALQGEGLRSRMLAAEVERLRRG